jgi:hypothetical protein
VVILGGVRRRSNPVLGHHDRPGSSMLSMQSRLIVERGLTRRLVIVRRQPPTRNGPFSF